MCLSASSRNQRGVVRRCCSHASKLFRVWGLILAAVNGGRVFGLTDQPIYTDSLQNGWQNWGWATLNYNNPAPVHSGSASIAVTIVSPWQAIYIAHNAFDSSPYTNLTFWINGGAGGGQQLPVQGHSGGVAQVKVLLPPLAPNSWQQVTVSLAALGVDNHADMDGFWIQDRVGAAQPVFYVDDITLVAGTNTSVVPTNVPVVITVDAQLNRHPISPLIYGVAFASSNQLADLNGPLNRSGGNAETRYNWQLNAHNRAADWYFESLADWPTGAGAAADDFIANSKNGGGEPVITVPMIGWAPKLGPNRYHLASYSVAKYGAQTRIDPYWSDAGNGIRSANNSAITTNDPTDANFETNSAFQAAWIQHLTNRWGSSTHGGVRYYCMDNEQSIWYATHRDVRPIGPTMQEIRDRFFDYAGAVKAVDSSALILAPEEWGWSAYLYSGYDQQYRAQYGWNSLPDRANNGNWDYLPWLLDQFRQRATNTNQRLLDYLTVHFYPQGGEFGNDVSTATQLLRNRSTRSLWDANYVDPTWINSVVMLPRLKRWVSAYYPGTRVGITEYNWGAEAHINGATAQADILGIFGREGLDLGARWTTPGASTPTYKAIKMYRNYDGRNSTFGETGINVIAPNPDNVSAFGAQRASDGALTVMVINKQLTNSASAVLNITNCSLTGTGERWLLTSANAIQPLSGFSFAGSTFTNTLPPQSITLFVLPTSPALLAPRLRAGSLSSTNTFDLWVDGQAGQPYVLESSVDLLNWVPILTNAPSSNSWHVVLPVTAGPQTFYRSRTSP